jgi:hypothetical protein
MSLAEAFDEPVDTKGRKRRTKTVERSGTIKPDGKIVMDTADIDTLTRRLNEVRGQIGDLKKEEERLRVLILQHPSAKPGFDNGMIMVKGTEEIDLEDPELLAALLACGRLNEAVNMSLSAPKVRQIASIEPKVAAAVKTNVVRKLHVSK